MVRRDHRTSDRQISLDAPSEECVTALTYAYDPAGNVLSLKDAFDPRCQRLRGSSNAAGPMLGTLVRQ
ncbi:hypothetical protein J2S48_000350 [Promicromonospora iranensis]|uniref:YD repeat-containing protein n=1 Tax=Promicromonospora iranensis TaxID=1105144 RepID=A0ABU2CHM6_9MICO|nr:hypothetical protein [Promicromonospora iranensis]